MAAPAGCFQDMIRRIRPDVSIDFQTYQRMPTPISKMKIPMSSSNHRLYCDILLNAITTNLAISAQSYLCQDLDLITFRELRMLREIALECDHLSIVGLSLLLHASKATDWEIFVSLLLVIKNRVEDFRYARENKLPKHSVFTDALDILDSSKFRSALCELLHISTDRLANRPSIWFVSLANNEIMAWSAADSIVINCHALWTKKRYYLHHPMAFAVLCGHEEAHYQTRKAVKDENASTPDIMFTLGGSFIERVPASKDREMGDLFERFFVGALFDFNYTRRSLQLLQLLSDVTGSRFPLLINEDIADFNDMVRPGTELSFSFRRIKQWFM